MEDENGGGRYTLVGHVHASPPAPRAQKLQWKATLLQERCPRGAPDVTVVPCEAAAQEEVSHSFLQANHQLARRSLDTPYGATKFRAPRIGRPLR